MDCASTPLGPWRPVALIALALGLAASTSAQPESTEVLASGLSSPFGVAAGPDGNLYVVEQGTGVDDARVSIVTPSGTVHPFLVGLQSAESEGEVAGTWNIAFEGADLWVVQGIGDGVFASFLLRVSTAGFTPGDPPLTTADLDVAQDVGAFLMGEGFTDSNLYNLTLGPDGDLFLVDAGANAVLRRDADTGDLSVFALIPAVQNPTPIGPPMVEAVPTSIAFTGDAFLVTSFTGFPFAPGLSSVYRVGLDGAVTLLEGGFTSLVDVALDPEDGRPVVLSFAEFLLAPPPSGGFQPGTGALVKLFGSGAALLASGLNVTPAFAFGADGVLYVTSLLGELIRVTLPENLPPVAVGVADGDILTVVVGEGESVLDFSFLSPEAGQTATITTPDLDAYGDPVPGGGLDGFSGPIALITTPGNPATGQIRASGGSGIAPGVGTYGLTLVACDDGPDGGACTEVEVVVEVVYPPTVSCGPEAGFYVLDFTAAPDAEERFRIYSFEAGLLDFTGCSFVAFDGLTEKVVLSLPLTQTYYPFTEPPYEAGVDFPAGSIPDGPGALAVVQGTPPVGTDVVDVLGDVAHAVVYYDDENVFGVCGQGSSLFYPVEPCNSSGGAEALAEALARLGATASEGDGALDQAVVVAPNPVSGRAEVSFGLAAGGDVSVALFDALGRRVATLAEGPYGPGRHTVVLDTSALPSGVYVARVVTGEVRTARLTIAR